MLRSFVGDCVAVVVTSIVLEVVVDIDSDIVGKFVVESESIVELEGNTVINDKAVVGLSSCEATRVVQIRSTRPGKTKMV